MSDNLNKMFSANTITAEYIEYVKNMPRENYESMKIGYGLNLAPTIFTDFKYNDRSDAEHISVKRLIDTYSVDNILKLGFAVMRGSEGVIASTKNANIGDNISIELIDGELNAEIKSINRKTI
jgi:exonuclease VII large subunit